MQENINFTISRHGINVRFHRELAHQEQPQKLLNDATIRSFSQDGQYQQSNFRPLLLPKKSTIDTLPYQVASLDHNKIEKKKSYKILRVKYDGNKNLLENDKKQGHNYETESEYFGDSEQNVTSESYLSSQPFQETSSDYEADIDEIEPNIEWERKCLHLLHLLKKNKNLDKQEEIATYKELVKHYMNDYHSQAQLPMTYTRKSSQDSQCQTISPEKLTTHSEGQKTNVQESAEVTLLNLENDKEKQTRNKRETDTNNQFSLLMSMLNEADKEYEASRKCKRCWNEGLHATHHYPQSQNEKYFVNDKYDKQLGGISPMSRMPDPSWYLYHNRNPFVEPASYKFPLPYHIKHKILKVPKRKYHVFNQKPRYEQSQYSHLQPNTYKPIDSRDFFAKYKNSPGGQKQKTLFLPLHYPNAHHLQSAQQQKLTPTYQQSNSYGSYPPYNDDSSYQTLNSDSYETYDEYIPTVQNREASDNIGQEQVCPNQHSSRTAPASAINYHVNQMKHKGSYDLNNVNHQFPNAMNQLISVKKNEKPSDIRDNTNTYTNMKNINVYNRDLRPANDDNEMGINIMNEAEEISRDKKIIAPPSQNAYFNHKFMNDKYQQQPITPTKTNYNPQPFAHTKEVTDSKYSPAENNNGWVRSNANILNPENLREIYKTLPTNYEFSAGQWVHIKPAMQPRSLESIPVYADQNIQHNYEHRNVNLPPDKYCATQAKERSHMNGEIQSYIPHNTITTTANNKTEMSSADMEDRSKHVNATNFHHYLRNYKGEQPTTKDDGQESSTIKSQLFINQDYKQMPHEVQQNFPCEQITPSILDEKEEILLNHKDIESPLQSTLPTGKVALIKLQHKNVGPYQKEENHSEITQENHGESINPFFSSEQAQDQRPKEETKLSLHNNITDKYTPASTYTKTTQFDNNHPMYTEKLYPSPRSYQPPLTISAKSQFLHEYQELHQNQFSSSNRSYNTGAHLANNELQEIISPISVQVIHPNTYHKNENLSAPINPNNTDTESHNERTLPISIKQQTNPSELSSMNKILQRSNEVEEKQNMGGTFLPTAQYPTFTEANQELLITQGNQITVAPKSQFPGKFYSYNTKASALDASELHYAQTETWLTQHDSQLGSSIPQDEKKKWTQTTTSTTDKYIETTSKNYNIETEILQNDAVSTTEVTQAHQTTISTPEKELGKGNSGLHKQKSQTYLEPPLYEEGKSDDNSDSATLVPENRSSDSKETFDYSFIQSTPASLRLSTEFKAHTSGIATEPLEAATSTESIKITSISSLQDKPYLNDQEEGQDLNAEENESMSPQKKKGKTTPRSTSFSNSERPTILSSVDIHTEEYLHKFDSISALNKEEQNDFEHAIYETTPLSHTPFSETSIKDLKTTTDSFPAGEQHTADPNLPYSTENKIQTNRNNKDSTKNSDKPSEITVNYESHSLSNEDDMLNISSMNTNHSGPIFNLFKTNKSHKSIQGSEGSSVIVLHNNTRYLSESQDHESTASIYETSEDISQIPTTTPRSITSYTITKENNSTRTMSMTTIFSPSSTKFFESNQNVTDKTDSFIDEFVIDPTQRNSVTTPQPDSKGIYASLTQHFHEIQDNKKYYIEDDFTSQASKEDDEYEYVDPNVENNDPFHKDDEPPRSEVSINLDQSLSKQREYNTSYNEDFTYSSYSGSSYQRQHDMYGVPEYSGSIYILNPINGEVTHNIPVTGKLLPYLSQYRTFPFTHTYSNTHSWANNEPLLPHTSEVRPVQPSFREQDSSNSQSTSVDTKGQKIFETPIISHTNTTEENTTLQTNVSGAVNPNGLVPLQDILMRSNYFTPGIENSSDTLNPNYIVAQSREENSALKESSVLTAIYNPTESSKRILIPTYKPSILTSIQKNSTCESAYKQYIYKYFLRVLLAQYVEEIKNNEGNQCTDFCTGGKLPSVCDECIKQLMQEQKQDEQDFAERIRLYNSQHCTQNYNGSEQYLEDGHPCAVYSSCKFSVISSILEKFGKWLRNI